MSAIVTHFLQTVFSTVHYMILLCQIPFHFQIVRKRKCRVDFSWLVVYNSEMNFVCEGEEQWDVQNMWN